MFVVKMDVTHYPPDGGTYSSEKFDNPSWADIERQIRNMHRFERPMLFLQKHSEITDADIFALNGGQGLYHVQYADSAGNWFQAFDPNGSDEIIQIWTSDQGFETPRSTLWEIDDALKMTRWYVEHGTPHPDFSWN